MFKLSSEAAIDGVITVENKFIVEYMPYADGDYVKVYLYGLSLAARKSDPDDTTERLARRLDLDPATVNAAFEYWEERGLMTRLGDDITYLSTRTARPKIKKFDVDKYAEFNRLAQLSVSGRQIAPNEYHEYYALMEKFGLEWQAMALIVRYCVNLKGDNVACPYILAVARNLAEDGYRSQSDVENRLEEYGVYYNDLCAVMNAFGSGKRPDHEGVKLYKKWKLSYKFAPDVILKVAETVKRGGIAALDNKLTTYYELGLMTYDKIDGYETERRELYKLAKTVNKTLGIYYENVDPEISSYIKPYLDMGFESGAIVAAADYCMKNGLKTLPDLDTVVRKFFARSALTEKQVKAEIDAENKYDGAIEKVLAAVGIMGAVNASHRAYYSKWARDWNMPAEVIDYAATLSAGKTLSYLNAILSSWHDGGVTTVEQAKEKNSAFKEVAATSPSDNPVVERYTADELNALMIELTDED